MKQVLTIFIGLLTLVAAARAEDVWTLTTADFRSERVGLKAIDNEGLVITSQDNQQRRMPIERLLILERAERLQPMAGKFVAILNGGDRAAGQPKLIEGENLIWESGSVGQISLPLKSVVAIMRSDLPPSAAATQNEDVVTLSNGDSVRGIVTGMDAASVSVRQANGETTQVPLDSVQRMTFAATAAATPQAARGFRVSIADGSAVTAANLKLADQTVSLSLPDGTNRNVPLRMVAAIEQVNGPVVWLSTLVPVENVHKPFLELSWPAKMDRSVTGEPIRFSDRTFSRGIGVHSYSRLTYAIDPAWKAFRTQYAMADELPYANVTVRIILDGEVAREFKDIRAGTLAPPLIIDLDGKKQLTLEVDYGQNYDVQDRFNWIEPAFLRNKTEPATQEAR